MAAPGPEGVAPDGTIRSGAHRSLVAPVFEPLLHDAADALVARPGVGLHLYGSVATGRAVPGSSDVDLLTTGLATAEAAALGRLLSRRWRALCRGVEVVAVQPADLAGPTDEAYGNRAFLRHYGVHLAGVDLAADLPAVPADDRAARGFNGDVGRHLARWRGALQGGVAPGEVPALARVVARKTLLAVAGLVSAHDATWTTDRAHAARRWGELEPGWAEDGARLLRWSGGDELADLADLARALDEGGPVEQVVRAFARRPGLWR